MTNMNDRLNKLESQLKWYKNLMLLSWLGMGIFAFLGFSIQQDDIVAKVRTYKLELVNTKGKTILAMEPRETAGGLVVYNNTGKEMVYLGADKSGDGGLLQLTDREGGNILQARTNLKGGAMKIFDNQNQNVIFVGEDPKHDQCGFINIARNGASKVILDGHASRLFIADPTLKHGFLQIPE